MANSGTTHSTNLLSHFIVFMSHQRLIGFSYSRVATGAAQQLININRVGLPDTRSWISEEAGTSAARLGTRLWMLLLATEVRTRAPQEAGRSICLAGCDFEWQEGSSPPPLCMKHNGLYFLDKTIKQ